MYRKIGSAVFFIIMSFKSEIYWLDAECRAIQRDAINQGRLGTGNIPRHNESQEGKRPGVEHNSDSQGAESVTGQTTKPTIDKP